MNALNELIDYCREHKHWVTFNYSPFDGTYQIYVNPGRTMSAAKRHKSLADAVRSVWIALGVKHNPMPKELVTLEEMRDTMMEVIQVQKRRGRPKGSKNRPKAVAE